MPLVVCKNGEKVIVDRQDYEKANSHNWYTNYHKKGYVKVLTRLNGKKVSFSNVVFGVSNGRKRWNKYRSVKPSHT